MHCEEERIDIEFGTQKLNNIDRQIFDYENSTLQRMAVRVWIITMAEFSLAMYFGRKAVDVRDITRNGLPFALPEINSCDSASITTSLWIIEVTAKCQERWSSMTESFDIVLVRQTSRRAVAHALSHGW